MATFFVYGLASSADPMNIRYVGAASRIGRPLEHAAGAQRASQRTHRRAWLRKVLREGHHVLWRPLEDADSWAETLRIERAIIRTLRAAGCDLVNGNDGGLGGFNPTKAARRRLSVNNGMKRSTVAAKQASSLSATRSNQERSVKMRVALAKANRRPAKRAKQVENLKKTWADPDRGAKLRAGLSVTNTPKAHAKQALSLSETWADLERGAKLRAAAIETNRNPERSRSSALPYSRPWPRRGPCRDR